MSTSTFKQQAPRNDSVIEILLKMLQQRLPPMRHEEPMSHSDTVEPVPANGTRTASTQATNASMLPIWLQELENAPHAVMLAVSVPGLGEVPAVHAAVASDQLEVAAAMLNAFPKAHFSANTLFSAFIELLDRPLDHWAVAIGTRTPPPALPGFDGGALCVDDGAAHRYRVPETCRMALVQRMLDLIKGCSSFVRECGVPALCCAALHGNWKAAELLLKAGVQPNTLDERGWSPLHYAVGPSCTADAQHAQKTCAVLLAHGAKLELASQSQANTPLLTAAWSAKPSIVQWLLEQGANISATNSRGSGILHSIVSYSESAAAAFFHSSRSSAFDRSLDSTYVAATEADLAQCIKICFDHGLQAIDANQGNYHGTVPLLWASLARRTESMQALCEAGASARISDNNGTSALHALAGLSQADTETCACTCTTEREVSVSIESGFASHRHLAEPCSACTAFDESCRKAVRILVKYGANINCASAVNHVTPLMNAAASGNVAVAIELLKAGADPTISSTGMSTALHYCCNYSEPAGFETAEKHRGRKAGGCSGAKQSDCERILHLADKRKAAIAAELLQHRNCAPNARDANGFTPVLMAAWSGLPQLLWELLHHPAVDNLICVQGWRLYHVLGMLKATGADKQLAECVKMIHAVYPPIAVSMRACMASCWRFMSGSAPSPLGINDTVQTASGPRTPLSLVAECLRPATVQAMFDLGALDDPLKHSMGTARCIHFVAVGKRGTQQPDPEALCAFAQTLTSSFAQSSRLDAETLSAPHMKQVVSSWKELPPAEEQALTDTVLLFLRRGEDIFARASFFWPVMEHALPRRKLKWCVFDYLVAGGFVGTLSAVHKELTWAKRKGLLQHRLVLRARRGKV